MKTDKILVLKPVYWSSLIFLMTQALTLLIAWRENPFLQQNNIYVPSQPTEPITFWPGPATNPSGGVVQTPVVSSLGPILIYFFTAIIVLGIILFIIPASTLRLILKALFAFLFGWGIFIVLVLWLPFYATVAVAVIMSLLWFFIARIWLHNIVMLLALVALGAVFGRFISPWTSMIMILVISLYDFLAVRFGYMLWMVKKISGATTPPAFIIPHHIAEWNSSTREPSVIGITETKTESRLYSIVGGGDIGFPTLLVSSIYFADGLFNAVIVALFSLIGLVGAYWIQSAFFKGKPVPALPPIAFTSLIGLALITAIL